MEFSIKFEHLSNDLLKQITIESKRTETLKKLLEYSEELLYEYVAANRYTDSETLKYLYLKYKDKVIAALRKNESTPPDILYELALAEEFSWNAEEMLYNKSLNAEAIDVIIDNFAQENPKIRKLAINHSNISAKSIIKLTELDNELLQIAMQTGKVKLVPADDEDK